MARLHPNVIKLRKQKRQGRRAYLKRYSGMVHTHGGVSTNDIPENQLDYFSYRRRGSSYWDAYLETKFPTNSMASDKLKAMREEALNRLAQTIETDTSGQNIPDLDVIVLRRGGITKTIIKFFYTPRYKPCFFMMEDWINMVVYRSGDYISKDLAMFAYQYKRINWLETIPIGCLSQPDG